jgi:RNA polymerase sigma factor (sigma-70 family)
MFPASVAVFKSGHDPSAPQNHLRFQESGGLHRSPKTGPERKERAALGMTAEEKEREGHPNSSPVSPIQISTIFAAAVRLQEWMDEPWSSTSMTERDRQISEIIAEERFRLRNFIRRRVPDPSDAEDIVQEVFYELVEANRLLMPIEHVTGWLFRVARNRITDLFRKKKTETFSDAAVEGEDGEVLQIEDLLPSPDAGPEALYVRNVLVDELELALDELPEEQREVFTAHEIEGYSFKEIAARTGVSVNTLLSRKRYAVLHLRERLQSIYDEFKKG